MKISGCNMDWPGCIRYGLVGQDLKRYINWFQRDVLDDFQNLFSFLGKCNFLNCVKNTSPKKSRLFLVFISLVDRTVHIRTKTCMKIAFKQRILLQTAFLDIPSQKYAKTSQVFQNIATLKSITMQMISEFMHFDTLALRQKMQFDKWTIIIFVRCTC